MSWVADENDLHHWLFDVSSVSLLIIYINISIPLILDSTLSKQLIFYNCANRNLFCLTYINTRSFQLFSTYLQSRCNKHIHANQDEEHIYHFYYMDWDNMYLSCDHIVFPPILSYKCSWLPLEYSYRVQYYFYDNNSVYIHQCHHCKQVLSNLKNNYKRRKKIISNNEYININSM